MRIGTPLKRRSGASAADDQRSGRDARSLTGIKRSPTQVRLFLKHLGLQRRKVGLLPAKGDPEVQEGIKKVGATLGRSASW